MVSDSRLRDSGICKLEVVPGTDFNMQLSKIPFTNGDGVTRFTVMVLDSLRDGNICIHATDCANPAHFADTCIHFCRSIPSAVQERGKLALALEANHPNPFSHITTFNYTVNEFGNVKLYLYDELGREIARIVDGAKAQGIHTIDFDGSKLPSGSYIVRLENGGGVVSRRVVVER